MKKLISMIVVVLFALSLTSCSVESVNGDEVGVFVKKPWIFGSGGVEKEVLKEGSAWTVFSTDFLTFKKVPQKYIIKFDDLMTDDNTPIDSKAYIIIEVIGDDASILYENYGQDWYANNINEQFSKVVRDKLSQHKMYDLTSNREIYDVIEPEIVANMNKYVDNLNKEKRFPIKIRSVIIDRAAPGNSEVQAQVNATAAQIQAKQTNIKQKEADIERETAEKQKAIADEAYQNEMGFTTAQYLQDKTLNIVKENGSKITWMLGGNAQPIFDPTK